MEPVGSASIRINGRTIGLGQPPYMVAELSGNHGGKLENALALIAAAKDAGADAIKFQTYRPDTITLDSNEPAFQVGTDLWAGRTLFDVYAEAHTPFDWHEALFARARAVGITAFSAPFDDSAVDLLQDLGCPAYKIASCELVDIGLIRRVAKTGQPVIMSTGMATADEVAEALAAARGAGASEILLMHCVSSYPTPAADASLGCIQTLARQFDVPVGFSDHTEGTTAAIAAVALGACMIEKHFKADDDTSSIDAAFSLPVSAFKTLAADCRDAALMIGGGTLGPRACEADSFRFRRSLYFVRDITAGSVIDAGAIRSVRPSGGLHTRHLADLIGKKMAVDARAGTPVREGMIKDA